MLLTLVMYEFGTCHSSQLYLPRPYNYTYILFLIYNFKLFPVLPLAGHTQE